MYTKMDEQRGTGRARRDDCRIVVRVDERGELSKGMKREKRDKLRASTQDKDV